MAQLINLNDTTPAAPAGARNVKWQADSASLDPTVTRNASAYITVPEVFNGSGAPAGATGVDGDYYLRTDTGDWYKKASGAWSKMNLRAVGAGAIVAGSNMTVTDNGDGTTTVASLPNSARASFVITTASLAVNAEEAGSKTIGKTIGVIKVQTSDNARVRLYSTAAQRDADASRAIGTPPTAGTAHGVIGEWVLNGTTGLTFICSPEAWGSNGDSPAASTIYYRIENMGAVTQTITATITAIAMES